MRVVVITGASSGIGRATAHAFAADGAALVLAGRGAAALDVVAGECRGRGAEVLTVPTDVSVEEQVEALAAAAVARFDRIDVWVGCASVFSLGTFEEMPPAVFRQLIETNLFGQVYGARAVLPFFRQQQRGVLISVGSVYSRVTAPFVSPYVTSKFGLLGFMEALREELLGEPGIRICTVLPSTIDTPIYQHAANYTGKRIHPLPPVVDPLRVARSIMRVADRPRRVTIVGRTQGAFLPFRALLPRAYEPLVAAVMRSVMLRGGNIAPSAGNVFAPDPDPDTYSVSGGWRLLPRLRRFGLARRRNV
ncbi:NAD(P)-dependent dehydrogenase (short-subunit alcohol dehydrogenase family) [Arthrobacter sp. CAN_A214]|uniref:SDR family NAD(P)-dependent oxidoreductase n=1 Tax=Arthrobacter sp. CAN_A214 TaxID=2787720 RepID=UPI0018CB5A60